MKVFWALFSILVVGFLVGVLPAKGISAEALTAHTPRWVEISSLLGLIPQYIWAAGEPVKLLVLGVGLIVVAIRLRRSALPEDGDS